MSLRPPDPGSEASDWPPPFGRNFRTMLARGLGQDSLEQGFRRMVFNLAAANRDDHVKNVSFLMTPDGRWRLSPAFDVNLSIWHRLDADAPDDVGGEVGWFHAIGSAQGG